VNTIKEIKSWPADAAVEAVQGKIVAVYERRNVNTKYGMKTVQSAELQDTTGEKIKIGAWDHPDLKPLEGKEIILHSPKGQNGKASGVKVMHDSYTNKANQQVVETKLSVSKAGQFQLVEVYHQTNPQMAANRTESASNGTSSATPASAPASDAKPYIHPATIGMTLNQVCANLTARGENLDPDVIWKMASQLVKVPVRMEKGDLWEEGKE